MQPNSLTKDLFTCTSLCRAHLLWKKQNLCLLKSSKPQRKKWGVLSLFKRQDIPSHMNIWDSILSTPVLVSLLIKLKNFSNHILKYNVTEHSLLGNPKCTHTRTHIWSLFFEFSYQSRMHQSELDSVSSFVKSLWKRWVDPFTSTVKDLPKERPFLFQFLFIDVLKYILLLPLLTIQILQSSFHIISWLLRFDKKEFKIKQTLSIFVQKHIVDCILCFFDWKFFRTIQSIKWFWSKCSRSEHYK